MRLFVALNLSDETKNKLEAAAGGIKSHCRRGNFSRRDNYHLTLAFIGEAPASAVSAIKAAIPPPPAFTLEIDGCGEFRRDGGSIIWAGVKLGENFSDYRRRLAANLRALGYDVDSRFTPHITLAREAVCEEYFDAGSTVLHITDDSCTVDLMKSERVNGILTYTKI